MFLRSFLILLVLLAAAATACRRRPIYCMHCFRARRNAYEAAEMHQIVKRGNLTRPYPVQFLKYDDSFEESNEVGEAPVVIF
ncbi:hypothetical protein Q1695_003660 [Nippostrongylus brasiliensis]|nr:hypothetical protein Q1695_003660 [Nippostrongylus brasiliensis]